MVHVHVDGTGQIAHVKRVAVAVLIPNHKMHGRLRIPSQCIGPQLELHLPHRHRLSDVVERDAVVRPAGSKQRSLGLVEPSSEHHLAAPLERVQRMRSLYIPDIHHLTGGHQPPSFPVVINGCQHAHRVESLQDLQRLTVLIPKFLGTPLLNRLVIATGEEESVVVAGNKASDEALVSPHRSGALARAGVPPSDLPVAAARPQGDDLLVGTGHALHRIRVSLESPNKRLREHLLHFGRVQRPDILPLFLEGVQRGVRVAKCHSLAAISGDEIRFVMVNDSHLHGNQSCSGRS
mmetsp:Transcript_15636/g.37643  ORF Transcript_15636/g.37643 Transcript_15636/m.37643 type:complete len:292 (+) Transcript_15636:675-1550(+)